MKKDKIKREKLSKKYEERIRNFIYQLSNNNDHSNISIKTKNPLVDLLNNQNEKNKKYQDLINEKRLIKKIYKNLYDKKKSRNKFSYNSDINDINNKTTVNYFKYSSFNNINNNKIFNKENINNKIYQPRLRFKPRNDLEKLYDEIKNLKLDNDNYLNYLKKDLQNLQKKEIFKRNNNSKIKENNIKNNTKEYKNFINGYKNSFINNKKIKKNNKLFKINSNISNSRNTNIELSDNKNLSNLTENKSYKKINYDIIKTKNNFHKNLDVKTYFNGIKNYILWKDTCFIKPNPNLKLSLSSKNFIHNKKNNLNISPIKKYITSSSRNKIEKINLIHILNSPKKLDILKYKNLFDDETNDIKINTYFNSNLNKTNINDEFNLKKIKEMAFNKNYIDIPGFKTPKIFQRKNIEIKKEIYDDIHDFDDYMEKKDISALCNKIMEKYGLINKKYIESYKFYKK